MEPGHRSPGSDRPRPAVPLPPDPMPLWRAGRPLKRWRYVGAFFDEVMVCVATARVGPAATSWWAAWDRRDGRLHGRTWLRRGGVRFAGPNVTVADGAAALDLRVDEGAAVETVCPVGDTRAYTWTRKQAARPVQARIALPGARILRVAGLAVVDDSAGYHPRATDWWWSAGVGQTDDGRTVGWNLVTGLNDPERGSERAVWVDGHAYEPAPVRFDGLRGIDGADGERLDFTAEATRVHDRDLGLVRSAYEQPFGTFAGNLPGGVGLATSMGVMERHEARW